MSEILARALQRFRPLRWDAVLTAIGWDSTCGERIPVPHNSVLTIQLFHSKAAESKIAYQFNGKFNRSQFAWRRWKYINPRATILNYPNKCIVVGATTPNRAFFCVLAQNYLFEKAGTVISIQEPPTVSNIVLAATLVTSLDIAKLASQHPSRINYEPREFSGATFTPFDDQALSGCKANIFEQGAYTILGATNMPQVVVISKLVVNITRSVRIDPWNRISIIGEREQELLLHRQQAALQFEQKEKERAEVLARLLRDATGKIQKSIIRSFKTATQVEEY